MNSRIKTLLLGGSAALVTGALMVGCASKKPAEPAPAAAAEPAPVAESRPGRAEEAVLRVTAKVQAINKKKREVTLKFPDGRTSKIQCGPEVRNFAQIQVGDDVTAEFRETVELFVADQPSEPDARSGAVLKRAPKGSRPAGVFAKAFEVTATVEAIDYDTRQVTLKGPEGKTAVVTAGPEVQRLHEVKPGDTVVARYRRVFAIQVTAPEQPKKK